MANTKRYRPDGPWSVEDEIPGPGVVATIQVADLIERFTSRRYVNGAYKVTFRRLHAGYDVPPAALPRAKSFYGETAWNDSRRYAEDELLKIRMKIRMAGW